ncbi:thyrotropin-releasing hormone receptor-like [Paramacrobiotus metropolitanus]|uniref:thyrotropin-releasing hormone receptor-like n=1 Tax=Paramacrobiotus metropolitanus TaxID=2943436 RepID=UPI0024456A22|nr:thyrotropin-releasing hormone receptor-like [Paramacrobiotus metropolitanus]
MTAYYNASRNGSGVLREPPVFPLDYRITATVVHSILLLLGVFGNIVVMLVVKRTRIMHIPTYWYLVSLSAADLLSILVTVPEAIISYQIYAHQWIFGQIGCSLLIFLQFLGINASSLSILAFTVERFVVICRPLHAKSICTMNRARRTILALWLLALVTATPWLFLTVTRRYPGYPGFEFCDFRVSPDKYRYIFGVDMLVFYVIPLLTSCVMYFKMNTTLRSQIYQNKPSLLSISRVASVRRSTRNGRSGSRSRASSSDAVALGEAVDAASAVTISQSRLQVVRMLFVVVALFAVLWLPYRAVSLYNSLASKPILNKWFMLFAKTCIFFNASVDPLLYSAMSRRFRKAAFDVLTCRRNRLL